MKPSPLASLLDISPDGKTLLITQPTADGPQALVALDWGASVGQQLPVR